MVLDVTRRGLITGLVSLVAAPAIVRVGNLMPVKVMEPSPIIWRAADYGKSRMFAMMVASELGLYEIWWAPGEDAPRIRNVTPEIGDKPAARFIPVP